MAEPTTTSRAKKKNTDGGSSVPLIDIVYRTLHYWPWLLLSLFVCVGAAVLYLLCTPKIYTTSASLLIKEGNKNNMSPMGVGGEEFANMGLFQNKTNIQNEITTLMSSDLMSEVARRLKLDVNYYTPGTFHREVAYGYGLPVTAEPVGFPANGMLAFSLAVSPDSTVTISELSVGDAEPGKEEFRGRLNDTIATAACPIVVSPTEWYKGDKGVLLEVEKVPMFKAVADYNGSLMTALNSKDGSVVDLIITDQSTQRAQDVLSTLIGVYNENWISDKNQIAVSTSNFINERLGVIESELGSVDSDISSFKSKNLVPDVSAAASMYMSQSQQTQAQIFELNNQLQMTRYIRSYMVSDGDGDKLLPANTGLASSDIQSLIGEYNQALLQRNSLIDKSSDKNPLVVQLDNQLSAQRQAIIQTIDNEIISLNSQISALRESEARTTSRLASNPTQAKNLLSVERQQKVKESLYLFLLQKREENELSQAFTAYNTRIIKKPASWGPTAPNSNKIILSSILIGIAIPFGIVFLREANNTRVRGRKDVENLAVPFLGEIPLYAPSARGKGGKAPSEDRVIVVREGKRNIINEAFRVLRTNVEFMCGTSDGNKVIAITSFNPGSGKSFISVNLGKSIALKGKSVLIVDGDMRHGSTSGYVGSPEKGLSAYLSGAETDVDSLIVKESTCATLDFLPVGAIPPNPTEMLESSRFAALLERLKPRYDYVIIDCPPIEVVADAQIIDKYADRTFFVIRAGLLDRSMLPELDRLYEDRKYVNMAFILNGTRNDQGRYGYSHSYRYGYGYGYGYGYNYGADNKK